MNFYDLEVFSNEKSPLQEPLLAYLPPAVLFSLDLKAFNSVIDRIKGLKNSAQIKKETIHTIAQASIRLNNSASLNKCDWLIKGLTPDELQDISIVKDLKLIRSFKLDLTAMQARAVFGYMYQNMTLNQSHAIDCQPVLPKLSPSLLLKFPTRELSYDVLMKMHLPHSISTACQIREYVMAYCKLTGKLPEEDGSWGIRVRSLGVWVYTLPVDKLKYYGSQPLSIAYLVQIQSSAISPLQAYYLTGKGESLDLGAPNSVIGLNTFLQALPTTQLVNREVGEISSQVQQYLAANLPADNKPRTVALVHKLTSSIDEWFIMESLLENRDMKTIMNLVSPKDLKADASRILKMFAVKMGYGNSTLVRTRVPLLPQQVLAVLLEEAQRDNRWSWLNLLDSSHVCHLLVGALTCQHIQEMDTGLFVPIMALYNRQRQEAFPKNLQICSLKKLISHLQLKMTITQTDPSYGLISLLEPIEIESVGGFVLLKLPVEAMRESPYLGQILSSIGRLSNAELMLATNRTHLQTIAQLAVDKEGKVDANVAGNLIWYLLENKLVEFKLMLETSRLDTTICLPAQERKVLAGKLIEMFGSTESWSAGVLATLQDLLLVFTDDQLKNILTSAWTDAADCFQSHYGDDVKWIDSRPFHEVCGSILGGSEYIEFQSSLSRWVKWRLQAAQWQLQTIKQLSVSSISNYFVDNKILDEEPKIVPSAFNPDGEPEKEDDAETYDSEDQGVDEEYNDNITTNELNSSDKEEEGFSTTMVIPEEITFEKEKPTIHETISEEPSTVRYLSSSVKTTTINRITQSIETVITIEPSANKSYPSMINDKEPITDKLTPQSSLVLIEKGNVTNTLDDRELDSSTDFSSQTNQSQNESIIEVNTSTKPEILHTSNVSSSTATNFALNIPEKAQTNRTATSSPVTFAENNSSLATSSTEEIFPGDVSEPHPESNYSATEKNNVKLIHNDSETETKALEGLSPGLKQGENDLSKEKDKNKAGVTTEENENKKSEIGENEMDNDKDIEEVEIKSDEWSILKNNSRKKRKTWQSDYDNALTCNALRMVGKTAALALTEMDLEGMAIEEVDDCRVELGAMNLTLRQQKIIWKRINKHLSLPEDGVHLMGNLLKAAAVGDLWDIEFDISKPWALETIDAFIQHANNTIVLDKLLQKINSINSEYSKELLAVLGSSVCKLDPDRLQSLSIVGLGPWAGCPICLSQLAELAITKLGDVLLWTQHHVHTLHSIVAGLKLEDWKKLSDLPHKPLSALQPSAIRCLNNSHLEALSPAKIKQIPTLSLLALSKKQLAALNQDQSWAVENATKLPALEKLTSSKKVTVANIDSPSSSNEIKAAGSVIGFMSVVYILCYV